MYVNMGALVISGLIFVGVFWEAMKFQRKADEYERIILRLREQLANADREE